MSRPREVPLPTRRIAAIRRDLLGFYDSERRDLPWRRTSDPYLVWISEVMLQQTRVEAVIPFYERWLARFPTVQSLAEAPADDVLKAWEGLGYYSRARNLQHAARIVRERHAGCLPHDPAALRSLPGIGEYTAGAIASIAYDVRAPAVDGNVRRVLARLLDEPRPSPTLLRRTAAALLPTRRAGDFNQALMELGASICRPANPACGRCPIARHCLARSRGTQADRPARVRKRDVPTFQLVTAVLVDGGRRVLLVRRSAGLLAGLWSFPATPLDVVPAVETAARFARSLRIRTADGEQLGAIQHTFTHRKERYHIVRLGTRGRVRAPTCRTDEAEYRWTSIDDLGDLALPVAQRRIAVLALGSTQGSGTEGSPRRARSTLRTT